MNKWLIGLGTLFAIVLGGLLDSSFASATSIEDDWYITTDTIVLDNNGRSNCPLDPLDVSLNWQTYITDEEKWFSGYNQTNLQATKTSFETALANGRWGVSYRAGIVWVYWTEDTSLYLEWLDGYVGASGNNLKVSAIKHTCSSLGGDGSNAQYSVTQAQTVSSTVVSWPADSFENYFVYTDFPNYPSGYEGEEIRDSYGEENDYNAGTGLIPVSDYTVNDLEIVIKDITSTSEKILYKIDECFFQLPNNSYGDNFTEYMYDCDNPSEIEHTFGDGYAGYNIIHRLHSTETDLWYESTLVLDIDGSTFSGSIGKIEEDIFAKCINEEAPYLHFKDCLKAFGKITNSMSFGVIKPLGAFRYEPTNECRELGTLGDWLNLDNKTICPQFTSTVRNTITPFMSFGLSLSVLGAILTKSKTDFM